MKTQTLSVLIPTRDRKKMLEKCLESVFVQSMQPFEIIVSDDASNDGTAQYLKKLAQQNKIKPVFLKERIGMISNKDMPANYARGDILVFIDDDIILDKDYLKNIKSAFSLDPKIAIAGGRVIERKRYYFWERKLFYLPSLLADYLRDIIQSVFHRRPRTLFVGQSCELGPGKISVCGNNLAIKRDVFAALGGRNKVMGDAYEDVELCLRAHEAGYRVYRSSDAVAYEYGSGRCSDADMRYYLELRNRVYVYIKYGVLTSFFQKLVFGVQLAWGAFLAVILSFKNPKFLKAIWGIFEGFRLARRGLAIKRL